MESETTKKNIFKKILGGMTKPFRFVWRKTADTREFMKNGRAGAIVLETVLSAQFMMKLISSMVYDKYPLPVMFVVTAAIVVVISELISLVVKLLFAGGKRCRTYFGFAWFAVMMVNMVDTQGNAIPGALLMSYLMALAADITGRIVWAFIKTRRFKQVTAYVLIVLCAAYYTGFVYFYNNDNFGDRRIDLYTSMCGEQAPQVQGFDAYLQNGSFEVATLSYGPEEDNDIVTETLDFTVFDSYEDRDPMSQFTDLFNDYDLSEVPVKGQIWYPAGQTDCPVFFMVHGNHDSYVPSYMGYEYLGEYLASNGYVVISVDENIINSTGEGNDKRAILLLENMKVILGLNEEAGSAIAGLINPELIAVGGHSRGGEMVATAYMFNDLDYYPEDGNYTFDYHFNITSIVAIAPVVDQYRPVGRSVEISDVNYLLIHGSNDQDVSIMMGEKQYNNVTFTGETSEFYMKASVYILGANHGQFNQLWGRYDTGETMPNGYLNTYNFIDEWEQKTIAMGYIRAFLDSTLGIDDTYESLMYDVDAYRSYMPDTVYITNYQSSNFVTLASFEDTVDIGSYEYASVNVAGADTWTLVPYDRGNGGIQEDYVLDIIFEEDSEPEVQFTFDPVDVSEGVISFGICDMNEIDAENAESGLDYTVILTDASGNTVSVNCPDFVYHTLAIQLYKQDVLFGSYEYKHQMATVTVTASDFADAGDFDFSAVTGVTITTDGSSAGEIIIDDLGYYPLAY